MADGAYRRQGHAPAPDSGRVDAIHDAFDDQQAEAFAEPARVAAVEKIERALAAARTGDLTEAHAQLTHARSVLEGLRPEALEPRRGLAGLFDSRGRRLKAFRAAYVRAAATVDEVGRELTGWIEGVGRRSTALETVWTEARDAVIELDAHLAAATRRLTGHAPAEGEAPHPLEARRATLDACRDAAVSALPLIRNAQNADVRFADLLRSCAEGAAAWRDDWKDALGLSGRKPKKVRPDRERLLRLRDDLLVRIDRALTGIAAARDRRAGVEGRLAQARNRL
ncbi:toxic anion resistance protein [Brevundimonas sp. GCM10030266]|uniref:toxic anion resistance protein n=1 Tax=Brevundimonas sp. GCM10030266 TaxID=3273386 RepID=UPI00360C7F41